MTITRNFKLCLNAGTQNAPYINANQYDEGEQWIFDLYTEGGQKFTPSTGAIIGIKSDGNAILNSGTVNSDGQVVITETQQMTAASGLAVFELLIEGETHGTANFIVNVERRPSDDAEFSDSDLSMLQEAIDAAEVINEVLDEGGDPSEIIAENVNNWLDNHPEATTTVEDGAITAPKINNSLWDKILVNEEASGNPASFEDGADDVPVSSLKVALEPVQLGSGDPSPSNIRPIYPSNGKNYLDTATTTSDYITYTQGADYYITASPSNSDTRGWSYANCQYKFTLPAGTYKFVWDVRTPSTVGGRGYRVLNSEGTILADGYGATLDTNGASSAFTLNASTNVGVMLKQYEMVARFMIVRSSESNVFQPYQGIMVERTGKNLIDESGLPKTVSGANYISFSLPSWAYERGLTEDVTLKVLGSLGEGKTRFALYICDTVNSNALYIGNSQYLTTANNFTLKGTMTNGGGVDSTKSLTIRIYAQPYDGSITSTISGLMLAFGDAEYEPYTGTSYPYTLGQSVYGGSVDLATGVLTVDRAYKTLKWSAFGSKTAIGNYTRGLSNLATAGMAVYPPTEGKPQLCDKAPYKAAYNEESNHFYVNATTINMFMPTDTDGDTDISVCYELATPTTVQLTPQEVKTLLGYNNISSSGTVEVIYHADTKLYIDKKIGELS